MRRGEEMILASDMKKDNDDLKLRDGQGVLVWTG
jgi:hypothetical protein